MKHRILTSAIGLVLSSASLLAVEETRFQVRHDHVIGSCRGELVFGETSLEYITEDKEDARVWNYEDIQQLGLLSLRKLSVLTYEDRRLKFGKDKRFNFELTAGEIADSLWKYLQGRFSKPMVSAIYPRDFEIKYKLAVKHQHSVGGCQGELQISNQYVVYQTNHPSDSRIWRYPDLSSVGSTGPFQLRLSTMERVHGEFGGEKNFVFDLKRRIEPEVYDYIWWKINRPAISGMR